MTPQKLKAKELIEKFIKVVDMDYGGMDRDYAKQCAIIVCDEVMKELKIYESAIHYKAFWSKVKTEINEM